MSTSPAAAWPIASSDGRSARRRPRRRGALRSAGLALALLAAAIAGSVAVLTLADTPYADASDTPARHSVIAQLDALAGRIGLGLDQIEISDHRFTSDSDILDAVDLANVHSFIRFDSIAIRARIERLAWVDTVTIERLLPNRVAIRVTERRPYAAWDRGPRDILIDATGRPLATVARNSAPDLPRVAGEHAPEDARRLLDLVAAYPDVAQRLAQAERVSGRRWRLVLRDGSRVELPADADAAALAMLVEPRPEGRLIDVAAGVIDLTVLRRITIRPSPSVKRS